jgi:hypothetical protein
MAMEDKELQNKIKKGGVLAQVSFEVVGNPKEHVEKTMKEFMDNIKKDSQMKVLSEEYGEAEELKGSEGLYSTFCDAEMLFENLDKMNWLCVNFMPSSIDIIAPEELIFKDKDLTNWFNDMLAKLHEVSVGYRQNSLKEELLTKNMNYLIQNAIILAAEHYHDKKEIGKKIGIDAEQLEPFFEALIKQHKLEKKGEGYNKKAQANK